jgi:hypothetical protein
MAINDDGCPKWAVELIQSIQLLEVKLGNVQAPGEWQTADMSALVDRLYRDEDSVDLDESAVESLFRRVARGLLEDDFEPEQIADFINARIKSGGRLPYCNASEVREAAGSPE